MSIREQVEDAIFLAGNGRYIGALTTLTLAVAATSRKIFPKGTKSLENPGSEMSDREAFTLFLGGKIRRMFTGDINSPEFCTSGISVSFRNNSYDLAYIIYKYYRCELVHDGDLPEDVRFIAPSTNQPSGQGALHIEISPDGIISLDYRFIDILVEAVKYSPCNGPEFGIRHFELTPLHGTDDQKFIEDLASAFGTSQGRIRMLKHATKIISPTKISASTDADLATHFQTLASSGTVHVDALSMHGITDQDGILQKRGIDILRRLSTAYELTEI